MIHLEPRKHTSAWTSLRSILLALIITALFSIIVLFIMSDKPAEAIWQMMTFPWQGRRMEVQWGLVLQQASIGAYAAYLFLGSPDTGWVLPVLILAGTIAGCLWGLIPAFLRVTSNTSELLTSLMLVYVASHFLTYLCIGPLKGDPQAGQAETYPLPDSVLASKLIDGTAMHTGLVIMFVAFVALAAVLLFTVLGYRLKVAQHTPRAERFAGFSPNNTVWLSFAISGAMAGLAGAVYLTSETGKLIQAENYLENFGFAAIVIAFLGRLHPMGILLAALLISYVNVGASYIQASLRVDDSVADLIEVVALFAFLGCAVLDNYKVKFKRSPKIVTT